VKHSELEEQLKFEKNYIQQERLKFCEEKLIQEKGLNDNMK